jgi:hypothetical protein
MILPVTVVIGKIIVAQRWLPHYEEISPIKSTQSYVIISYT